MLINLNDMSVETIVAIRQTLKERRWREYSVIEHWKRKDLKTNERLSDDAMRDMHEKYHAAKKQLIRLNEYIRINHPIHWARIQYEENLDLARNRTPA